MPASTFLNARPYTQLRGGAFLFLSDVGHILRGSILDDQGGGVTTTWGTVGTAVPCRVDAFGGSEALAAARISEMSSHAIVVPVDAGVGIEDRFAIDGKGTFLVTAVPQVTAQLLQMLEAAQLSPVST